jgi:AcrR family transcriptional regulator
MNNSSISTDWRDARRLSAREAIIDVAWTLASEEGLASWSLRDLARRTGISTPTVYAYFDSKNAIYDAMFGRAATQLDELMNEPFDAVEPSDILVAVATRFSAFCIESTVRYQLLFQRTLPGFEPSSESYAPAVRALARAQESLALNGITEARHADIWTALITGLVDQQVANDPSGERWTSLIAEATTMFLAHCQLATPKRIPVVQSTQARGTQS